MKRIGIICVILLVLVGCQKTIKIEKSEEVANLGFLGVSEDGIYHLVDTEFAKEVYFYDFGVDQDVPLCSKVNCDHKNKDCNAYRLTFYQEESQKLNLPPLYYQEKLYYFYEDLTKGKTVLCQSDIDGSNVKKVVDVAEGAVITNALFANQKLWYTENAFDLDEKGIIKSTSNRFALKTLDLSTLETKEIKKGEDTMITVRGMYNEQVYFVEFKKEKDTIPVTLLRYNEKENTFKKITNQIGSGNSFLIDKYYYDYDVKKKSIYRINVENGESEDIMNYQPEKGYKVYDVRTDDQGILTFVLSKNDELVGESYIDLTLEKEIEEKERIIYLKEGYYFVVNQNGRISKK